MTARNLIEVALAFGLFIPLLVIPGFVFGWISDVAGFRQRTPGTQLLLANVFSLSLCPILTYLIGRFGSFGSLWLFYAALWLAFLGLLLAHKAVRESLCSVFQRSHRAYLVVMGLWVVLGTASLIDIRTPAGLYPNLSTFDYIKHTSVVDAITRTGLPPVNPSFHPGRDLPLCYYYFWHLMCSLVDRMGGTSVGARSATLAGTLWVGLSLFSLVILYLRLGPRTQEPSAPRSELIALALLLVTGLDLLPVIAYGIASRFTPEFAFRLPTIEWWNEQVTAWANTMIWVPQHLASLVASLIAFLVLRMAAESRSHRASAVIFAALALASALGMSVWVALVAWGALAVWTAVCLWEHRRQEVFLQVAAAGAALVICLPFVLDLSSASESHQFPIAFAVREFRPLLLALRQYHVESTWLHPLLSLVLLPLNYLLELGFFFVASVVYWRWRVLQTFSLTVGEKFLLTLGFTSVLICTFFRSSVLYNDLGARGFLPAQFVMLLWSVPVVASVLKPGAVRALSSGPPLLAPGKRWRMILLLTFCVGASGTCHDLVMQRVLCIGPHGRQGLELAQAYEWVRDHTAPDQIVQHNPREHLEFFHGLFGNRQMVIADEAHGTLFGVDEPLFRHTREELQPLFESGCTRKEAASICREYDIDVLVFRPSDPIWADKESWIWKAHSAFQNCSARVCLVDELACED